MVSTAVLVVILLVVGGAILVSLVVLVAVISRRKTGRVETAAPSPVSTQQTETPPQSPLPENSPSRPGVRSKRCTSCGHANPPTHNFCEQCGAKL